MASRATFGRKASDTQPFTRDPSEFVRGKDSEGSEGESNAAATTQEAKQDTKPVEKEEKKVRITVDVPKSVHKQLQTVCNASDTKLGPYIRELIKKDLKRRQGGSVNQ